MTTEVTTTVPGNIWKVLVKEGDQVQKGDTLFIMEVMKTEVNHDAPIDGKVVKVNIVNDQEEVDPGTVAIIIEQIN
jgi:biotin carboxyl carrier protein|tara:strand:+ start:646 stop:873 length:228 start_codon:yes stop_codon:yes gene_type:complete